MPSGVIAIALVVGTAVLLERFMLDNGNRRYDRKRLITAAGFGLLALGLALLLELPLDRLFNAELTTVLSGETGQGAAIALATLIGIIEEASKFLPFSLFARKKAYLSGVTEGLILFTTVGLVFGVVETIGYMLAAGGGANTGFLRLTLLLFFHGALTGVAGFHFAKAHFNKESYIKSWLVLAVVAMVHGIYDFTISSGSTLVLLAIVITIALNCYLFWLYYKANVIDSQLPAAQFQPAPAPKAQTTPVNSALPPPQPQPVTTQQPPQQVSPQSPPNNPPQA